MGSGVAAEASGERSEAGGGVGGAPCGASACCCRFLLSSASQGGTAADTSSTAGSFAATPELVATGWLAAGAAADGSARSRAARIQGGSSLAAALEAGPGRLVLSAAAAGDGRTWAGAGSADGAPLSPSERSRAARRRSFSSSIAGEKPSWASVRAQVANVSLCARGGKARALGKRTRRGTTSSRTLRVGASRPCRYFCTGVSLRLIRGSTEDHLRWAPRTRS